MSVTTSAESVLIEEISYTTGTGTYTLSGATAGHRRFADGFSPGVSLSYKVTDGVNYEEVDGVFDGDTTITRVTVVSSSNSDGLVAWSGQTRLLLRPLATGSGVDSVATGIMAAGSSQSDAIALTATQNYISTGTTGQGVRIDTSLMTPGNKIYVYNETASAVINVYPSMGITINNQAANAGVTLFFNSGLLFTVKSTTALRTMP